MLKTSERRKIKAIVDLAKVHLSHRERSICAANRVRGFGLSTELRPSPGLLGNPTSAQWGEVNGAGGYIRFNQTSLESIGLGRRRTARRQRAGGLLETFERKVEAKIGKTHPHTGCDVF